MITLSLLKYLENNGFGKIDETLFWQKLGLGRHGIYITELGAGRTRGTRTSTMYELYSRGINDVDGYQKLQKVAEFLNRSYNVCNLPSVPPVSEKEYHNVTIMPVSTITNVGEDSEGRIIYSITGRVYYDDS